MNSRSFLIASFFAFSSTILAEQLINTDVPAACTTICKPVVELTGVCDTDPSAATLGDMMLNMPNMKMSSAQGNMPAMPGMKRRYVITNNMGNNDLSGKNIQVSRQVAGEPATPKACVCENKSFNVAEVAGLCASCMMENKGKMDEINRILGACSFSEVAYTKDKDSVAANINVQAIKPLAAKVNVQQQGAAMATGIGGSSVAPVINTLTVTGISEFPATKTEARFDVSLSTIMTMAAGGVVGAAATGGVGGVAAAGAQPTQTGASANAAMATNVPRWGELAMPAALAGAVVMGLF